MRRRRMFAALALAPVLALGAQACGGGDGGASGKGTAKAAGDQEKMRKYAQCMRDNGVDMDDPSGDGKITMKMSARPGEGKTGSGPMDEAQRRCRSLMPNGGRPPKPKPEEIAKQRAFSKCMREHGVPRFPDPDPNGGILLKAGKGTGLDPQSPAFKDAEKACRKYAPGEGPASTSQGDGN
ncbi:hypothetical protein [Actinomadura litoris]|uniref:hypothetical protein n=1 Tax=Actinomadura litoris TaxID=2678616 RepID=UPI001FA7998F|nr:hypothetical protein [Actinomadura litoris]